MQFYLFKKTTGKQQENIFFSDRREMWYAIAIKKITILSFNLPDRQQHFYFSNQHFFISFQKGDKFIEFLIDKGAEHFSFDLQSFTDNSITTKEGVTLDWEVNWISSGFEYKLNDKANNEVVATFQVPKSGKIELSEPKEITEISFTHKGERQDPVIARAFAKQSSNRKSGCVTAIILLTVATIGFYIIGNIIDWFLGLFGIEFLQKPLE